jgi:hypothetical protein
MQSKKQSPAQRESKAAADITQKKSNVQQHEKKKDKVKQKKNAQLADKKKKDKVKQTKPAQLREANTNASHLPPFQLTAQLRSSDSINGITVSENTNVKQLTGGQVDLHASGASVKEVSQSDSRLTSVGARSIAAGGQALVGDKRDRGHEIWHLAQQAQRRVQPTTSVNGQAVNDNPSLEKEADVMGAKVTQKMDPKKDKKKK